MMKNQKTIRWPSKLLTCGLIFVVMIVVFNLWKSSRQVVESTSKMNPELPSSTVDQEPEAKQLLNKLYQQVLSDASISDKFSWPLQDQTEVYWTMPDHHAIFDNEQWSIEADVVRSGAWAKHAPSKIPYSGVDVYNLPAATHPEVNQLLKKIDNFFQSQAFTPDKFNDHGYKTSSMWCHVYVEDLDQTNSTSKYGKDVIPLYVICSTQIGQIYAQQLPLYSAILKAFKHPYDIQKNVGNYVSFNTNDVFVIGEVKNGQFLQYFAGQDDPPCSIVEKYKIPGAVIQAVLGINQCVVDGTSGQVKSVP